MDVGDPYLGIARHRPQIGRVRIMSVMAWFQQLRPAQREYNPSLSGQHLGDNETQQQRFKTEEVNL